MWKKSILLFILLSSIPSALAIDVNISVNVTTYIPPPPLYQMYDMFSLILGAGSILTLMRAFYSDGDIKDRIALMLGGAIILALAVSIMVGLL